MILTPLDARYIAKVRPVCHDCGKPARWRLMSEDGITDAGIVEFCTEHAPVDPFHITGEFPA